MKLNNRLHDTIIIAVSGRHVVIVAQRTILPKTVNRKINSTGPRPRSRTLTSVQECILEVRLLSIYFTSITFVELCIE
jgi:small subunit ribosomal protein S7e